MLDTHGHYIGLDNDVYRTVAYYTGTTKVLNPSDYDVDFIYNAQFVDVATGDVEDVPVTGAWARRHHVGEYFDITDELNGNETYSPIHVFTAGDGATYGDYAYADKATFKATTTVVDTAKTDYLYNYTTVEFIIASHSGSKLVIDEYTGTAELIQAFRDKYNNQGLNTVTLANVAMVTTETTGNNKAATVIFAYDGAETVSGGILFFPKDVTPTPARITPLSLFLLT